MMMMIVVILWVVCEWVVYGMQFLFIVLPIVILH